MALVLELARVLDRWSRLRAVSETRRRSGQALSSSTPKSLLLLHERVCR